MEGMWVGEFDDPDPFLDAGVDLFRIRGHLVDAPAVDEGHFIGTNPFRRTDAVHGRVACADDPDPRPDGHRVLFPDAAEEGERVHDTVAVLTFETQVLGQLCPDGDEDVRETVCP